MLTVLKYMRKHGALRRFPGGFWSRVEWKGPNDGEWFGASTMNALQARGMIEWTGWQAQRNGPGFPIEARIAETQKQ